ncbi:MAG: threonine--tRNA ligase [Planctomycetes bacterium RIFCSPHIGHO2_02_FULL_50_42]|nr:MAG: threonine--tRNA ligase [Planctomycetes bacterium RIFCSPHIGHO2_02_FULL_50_42]
MIKVVLPDGLEKTYRERTTVGEVAEDLGGPFKKKALAGKTNGTLVDLSFPLTRDTSLSVITEDSPEALEILRHSTAHIMAQAVCRLFPGAKLGIGPTIENGFYYDFHLERPLTEEDLANIEAEMRKIIKEDISFNRKTLSRNEAIKKMEVERQPYKMELISDIAEGEEVSFYTQGEFLDLCRGPHIPSSGRAPAFKLLSVAGAYWRGKETNPMLQRIYGTAFFRQQELDKYLKLLEEAKRRDHRHLGKELDLYSIKDDVGAGLVLWHPKGARIRNIIERFWCDEHYKRGYQVVYSPHIAKSGLWHTSGHWGFYRESMFSPFEVETAEYLVKPMNCPFHILIFKSEMRSYRDLPLRFAELGTVYRYERSGVLHGLLRVRGFTQDDAHIFCTPEQLEEEIVGVIDLAKYMLTSFGFKEYEIELAVRGRGEKEKYIGTDETWTMAEQALRRALEIKDLPYYVGEGEAKFYGPSIDIKVKDALGRGWQGPTIQVDFNLPERFDVHYRGPDGKDHRVVMVHRTVLGAMERFLGTLIEHYGGDFPLWLAPVQVRLLPVSEATNDYAHTVKKKLEGHGLRAECDDTNQRVGYKIRQGTLEKVPYLLIVGGKEMENGLVSVRTRKNGDEGQCTVDKLLERLEREINEKV